MRYWKIFVNDAFNFSDKTVFTIFTISSLLSIKHVITI